MDPKRNWFLEDWRPAMAWSYLIICVFDFLLAPLLLGIYCAYTHTPMIMWNPVTLQGGAVYHASMGAICGVSAWSRGKEKIAVLQQSGVVIAADDSTTVTPVAQTIPTVTPVNSNITPVRRQGADE